MSDLTTTEYTIILLAGASAVLGALTVASFLCDEIVAWWARRNNTFRAKRWFR